LDHYSSSIIELCYISKASKNFVPRDFLRLIRAARKWNEAHHLTSILFFKDDSFCQIIEGSLKNLDLVCRRIRMSSSHHQVTHLETRQVPTRSIPEQALQFYAHDAVERNFPKLSEELAKSSYDRIALIRAIRSAAMQSSSGNI
jgi:hypothetical protein